MAKVYFYDAEGKRIELEVSEDIRDGYADIIRKQRRRADYEQYHSVSLDAITDAGHEFRDDTYNPERILVAREDESKRLERLASLREAMSKLKPVQRELIQKIFYEGMTQREAADYFGISQPSIDFVEYSGNNEKSMGVFGPDGLLSGAEIKELRKRLRKTDSTIWHGVVSFEKAFGDCYIKTQDDAYRLMKTEFPHFLKSAGLNPKNITWYAGLHTNTDNAHVHFSFFENAPARYRVGDKSGELYYSDGIIPKYCIRNFKIRAEQRLTDITAQISKARQETSDLMRDILFTNENRRKYSEEIAKEILELKSLLPKEGRLSYDSENMEHLRPRVRKIVDAIIKSDVLLYKRFNEFYDEVRKKDEDTKCILAANGIDKADFPPYLLADKYLNDLYRRLGNHVISAARYFKRQEVPAKKRTIQKRILKNARLGLLAQCAYMRINVEEEAWVCRKRGTG